MEMIFVKKNNKKKKKSNPKNELYMMLSNLIFIPMVMFVIVIIGNIIVDFNLLLGLIIRYFAYFLMFLFPTIEIVYLFISNVKESKRKNKKVENLYTFIIILLIFGVFMLNSLVFIIKVNLDYFKGAREVEIINYKIIEHSERKLNPGFDSFIGYDKDGNEYKLESNEYISLYDDKIIKIKYYENIKMIESFEYIKN